MPNNDKPMSPSKRPNPSSSPKTDTSEHRGYSLPPTSANPPMPPVKPPKQ